MKEIDEKSGAVIRNPEFFKSPPFWKSDWDEVNDFLDGLEKGTVREIGKSYGGRPIRAVSYGEKEPIERRCGISVSKFYGFRENFFDPRKRTRPVVAVISTIHGAEVEGCVSCINLAQIMEEGKDLRGRKWDQLRDLAEKTRLVMVPLAQPDGRIRSGIKHLVGGSFEDLFYYGQGAPREKQEDEPPNQWYRKDSPLTPDKYEFLGGYYNDAGVNIDIDDFFSEKKAPESQALINLVLDETPDMFIVLHSHNPGPWIASPNALIHSDYQWRQIEIGAIVADRHRREGLRPAWHPRTHGQEGYFTTVNLPTALHFVSGALPLAFEFPHGLAEGKPYTFNEILDIGLTLFEEILRFAVNWRRFCRS
ncbi:MAG TPA: M14 family zinc carboxypeptidase [bacterium]|nr:M14 family zinc carboxypeptidase [bacterium]